MVLYHQSPYGFCSIQLFQRNYDDKCFFSLLNCQRSLNKWKEHFLAVSHWNITICVDFKQGKMPCDQYHLSCWSVLWTISFILFQWRWKRHSHFYLCYILMQGQTYNPTSNKLKRIMVLLTIIPYNSCKSEKCYSYCKTLVRCCFPYCRCSANALVN